MMLNVNYWTFDNFFEFVLKIFWDQMSMMSACCLSIMWKINDVCMMCGVARKGMTCACCLHDVRMLFGWGSLILGVGVHKKIT